MSPVIGLVNCTHLSSCLFILKTRNLFYSVLILACFALLFNGVIPCERNQNYIKVSHISLIVFIHKNSV